MLPLLDLIYKSLIQPMAKVLISSPQVSSKPDQQRKARGGFYSKPFIKTEKFSFRSLQGTSMASPHVAGTTAFFSAGARKEDVALLYDNTQDIGSKGQDKCTGHGLLQLYLFSKYFQTRAMPQITQKHPKRSSLLDNKQSHLYRNRIVLLSCFGSITGFPVTHFLLYIFSLQDYVQIPAIFQNINN